eukprot:363862-Chlamydomonas_euryale.AAC.12
MREVGCWGVRVHHHAGGSLLGSACASPCGRLAVWECVCITMRERSTKLRAWLGDALTSGAMKHHAAVRIPLTQHAHSSDTACAFL